MNFLKKGGGQNLSLEERKGVSLLIGVPILNTNLIYLIGRG
jgi:hypothetical protein